MSDPTLPATPIHPGDPNNAANLTLIVDAIRAILQRTGLLETEGGQQAAALIGDLGTLSTVDKTSLVAAINEVKSTVPVFADGYDPTADGVWSSGNLLHRLSSLDNPSTLLEVDPDWAVTAPTLDGDAGDQTVTLGGVYAWLRTVERFPVWPGSLVWASVDLSAISDLPGERSAYLTMSWYDDEDTLLGWSNAGILDLSTEGGISTAFFQGNDGTLPTATHVRPGVAIAYPGQGVAGEQYAVYGLQIAIIGPSLSRLYGLVDLEGRLRGAGLVVEPAAGSDNDGLYRFSVRDEDTWDEFAVDSDVTATADGGTRARGTLAEPAAVELGDILRYLWWWEGHDGAGYSIASVAYLQVDDVVSEGIVPTAFVVEQADETGALVERLRIGSNGALTLPHASTHADGGSDEIAVGLAQITQSGATTGQVPKWSGSAWVPDDETGGGGGGGLVLVDSGTFSGSSGFNVDGVFDSTYDDYLVVLVTDGSTDIQLGFRLRASGTDSSSNYSGVRLFAYSTTVGAQTNNLGSDEWQINNVGSAGPPGVARLDLYGPAQASPSAMIGVAGGYFSSTGTITTHLNGSHDVSTAYDGFAVRPDAGTISGRWAVYGYPK